MPHKRLILYIVLLALFCASIALYTQTAKYIGSGTPPAMADASQQAHEVYVIKSSRELHLLRDGKTFKRYSISLGENPQGHKLQEGDERTPEGKYIIDWRNKNSIAHLSLHISYPNENDIQKAKALGVDPGGNIMIHGLPNGWGIVGKLHLFWDWTNGCIAVTNTQMQEIWSLVPNNTPITIVDKI